MFGGRTEWQRWLRGRLSRARSWTEAGASVHSMAVQLSTAGAHAQVLAKMLGGRAQLSELMSDRRRLPCLPSTQRERPAMRSEISRDALRATRAFCTLLARAHCSGHGAQVVFGMRKNVLGTDVTDAGILRSHRDV